VSSRDAIFLILCGLNDVFSHLKWCLFFSRHEYALFLFLGLGF